ncbi:YwqG family protein [Solirubrobacter taibaiensis]|nr:YwqG family protein [Solirubrobacter taibaiensis]
MEHVVGRFVVSGSKPSEATRVVIIDDRGDEWEATIAGDAWSVTAGETPFAEALVRFEDAGGAVVAQPLPDGERVAVDEADVPCPVCGAAAWVAIGERVHCERCGLRVGAGLFFMHLYVEEDGEDVEIEFEDDEDEDEDEPEDGDWEAHWRREQEQAVASAAFPVYGVPGDEPEVGGVGSGSEGVDTVTLSYGHGEAHLHVESRREEPWGMGDRLRSALADLLREHEHVARSDAAERVWSTHAERLARRRAAHAERETRTFTVNGAPEPFAFAAVDDRWVALREHLGVVITLRARGVDPGSVALAPVGGTERARSAAVGGLPRRDEVAKLIDDHNLSEHRDAILAAIRPGYRLHPEAHAPHRIGGEPDLAPGEQWPHDSNGMPCTFVAQFDCSRLPPLVSDFGNPPWNHGSQLLRIFAELEDHDGTPTLAVALTCSPDAPLTRTEAPPWPIPEDYGSLRRLEALAVRPVPFLTARVGWYVVGERSWETGYDAFSHQLEGGSWSDAQLLGHASNEQGDDPIQSGHWHSEKTTVLEDWATLFCLPRHPDMSFGDGGSLAIVIRLEDLAAGRYDRMVTDTSTG